MNDNLFKSRLTSDLWDEDLLGARRRWLEKKIDESVSIFPAEISFKGLGEFAKSDAYTRNHDYSYQVKVDGDILDIKPRPTSSLYFSPKIKNWQAYNRCSLWIYLKASGYQNFYFHFTISNKGGKYHANIDSLKPNAWNRVLFETTHITCDEVESLSISLFHLGMPPEGVPTIKFYLADVCLEKLAPDYALGWDLGDRIAYSHLGYHIDAKKTAITQQIRSKDFYLVDEGGVKVYHGLAKAIKTDLGEFFELDFSSFKQAGNYKLLINDYETSYFPIGVELYCSSINKSIDFLYSLRCGDDIPSIHSPCHLNSYTTHPDGRMVANHGGWHDAGDVSQFEICTAEMAHALLDLAQSMKDKDEDLYTKLLLEARWGINWLLRTRFGDGMRALAVSYSIWQPNVLPNKNELNQKLDGNINNLAEDGPFENLCAAAALAKAAILFNDLDPVFAFWCKRVAIEDYQFGVGGHRSGKYSKRWGPGSDAQVYGEAILAACELYQLTSDDKYLNDASAFAKIVLACQQSKYPAWDKPIRGFFYEDASHQALLTYEHRGHEQSPLLGLVRLLELAPKHKDAKTWLGGVNLYREYILSTSQLLAPYHLLPAHIYEENKINPIRFTIPKQWGTDEEVKQEFKHQMQSGIRLNEGVYLRRFPIAITRRGYHATLLSKTKAASSIGKLLNDEELLQVARNQIEWIIGKNPFATSTMYGEGHNYHPLYVAFSRQMLGALPVGFKTFGHFDAPFWPVENNAVYKEIWGHTTGKYLWVLADLV